MRSPLPALLSVMIPLFALPAVHAQFVAVPGVNVHVHVSSGLLNAAVYEDVSRADPVNEIIKGVHLRGTAYTSAVPGVELFPDCDRASFDLLSRGVIFTRLVGDADALNVHTDSLSPFEVRKRLTLEATGITGWPASTRVLTNTQLQGFSSEFPGKIPIALRETAQQLFEEDRHVNDTLASFRIQREMSPRFDRESTPRLQEAGEQFRRGLELTKEYGIDLEQLGFSTSRTALWVAARLSSEHAADLAKAPPIPSRADLAVRVHEGAINRVLRQTFGGKEIAEKELKATLKKVLDAVGARADLKPAPVEVALKFAAKEPITIGFASNAVALTIHIEKINLPTESIAGAKVRIRYKIEQDKTGLALVRDGRVELLSSTGQVFQDELLRAAIQQMLLERLTIGGINVPTGNVGRLVPLETVANNGWLLTSWRQGR